MAASTRWKRKKARMNALREDERNPKGESGRPSFLTVFVSIILFCVIACCVIRMLMDNERQERNAQWTRAAATIESSYSADKAEGNPGPLPYVSNDEYYQAHIMAKVAKSRLSEEYEPVHIFRDGRFVGSGTLGADHKNGGELVVTAAHVFPANSGKHFYGYRRFQAGEALEKSCWPIKNVSFATMTLHGEDGTDSVEEEDVAICKPGPLKALSGTSHISSGERQSIFHPLEDLPPNAGPASKMTFLSTGEIVSPVGFVRSRFGVPTYLVPYLPEKGQSGAGLIGSDGTLYVLVGYTEVTRDIRDALSLPYDVTSLAGCMQIFKGDPKNK